jgi:general stress protein 26
MTWDDVVAAATAIDRVAYAATCDADGRPHVAPVIPGFGAGTLWFAGRRSSRRARNLTENPQMAIHWPVTTGSGPGELFVRGTATIHDSDEERRRLWTEAPLPYDPADFFGNPDDADVVFVEVSVASASLRGPGMSRAVWSPTS